MNTTRTSFRFIPNRLYIVNMCRRRHRRRRIYTTDGQSFWTIYKCMSKTHVNLMLNIIFTTDTHTHTFRSIYEFYFMNLNFKHII